MQQNAFVQSMKTIAQSAITKAGFDKTRNGQIVGVNTVTNTYSIKVDGIIYNNVRVVNDMEYNKGDIVMCGAFLHLLGVTIFSINLTFYYSYL